MSQGNSARIYLGEDLTVKKIRCPARVRGPAATSESSSPASGTVNRRRSGQLASASPPVVIFRRWIGP